jgi:hypothetical protein
LPGDWQIFPEQVCPFVAAAVGAKIHRFQVLLSAATSGLAFDSMATRRASQIHCDTMPVRSHWLGHHTELAALGNALRLHLGLRL